MKVIISTILLGGWVLINQIYKQQLHDLNTKFTLAVQLPNNPGFNKSMGIFTNVFIMLPIVIILILHCFHKSKADSFYNFIIIFVLLNIKTMLKLVVREYRPFLMEKNIKALSCECSFGMPSGHAGAATIGALVMLESLLRLKK